MQQTCDCGQYHAPQRNEEKDEWEEDEYFRVPLKRRKILLEVYFLYNQMEMPMGTRGKLRMGLTLQPNTIPLELCWEREERK